MNRQACRCGHPLWASTPVDLQSCRGATPDGVQGEAPGQRSGEQSKVKELTIFRQEYRQFFDTLARVDAHVDALDSRPANTAANNHQPLWKISVDAHLVVHLNRLAPERSGAPRC